MLDPEKTTFVVITHGSRGHEYLVPWLEPLRQKGFPVTIIHKDKYPCWDAECKGHTTQNVGKEEFGYASFIVDNYDSLKNDYVFCHHDLLVHIWKHANPGPVDGKKLGRLWEKIATLENGRFGNFGNYFIATDPKLKVGFPRPDEQSGMKRIVEIHNTLLHKERPCAFISCQGAHHLVSAERIRSHSRDWWIDFMKLVVDMDTQTNQGFTRVNVGEIFCRLWEEIYIPREMAAIRGTMAFVECRAWVEQNSDRLTQQGIEYMSEE